MKRIILVLVLLASPIWAVEPDEMLADPVLEERAQALDHEIRCVQCQSESIASSNADWARDARLMVRELVSGGNTDTEVLDFFLARYGDVVLMRPKSDGANIILWIAGPVMLLLSLGVGGLYLRRRRQTVVQAPLSEADEARLREILEE
ncbi:cytochrome c-type biogenesis protein CcmH [Pseudohalocynthiibacter aestuariivivens]|jgi:cytochrome c-type biogenesis protein CcmH|uniref:Cytochrome c-type biogenesis protein n=1 Tax=Pseudohalocynthiibacter aestuariivivens TaxID=1591409 RepID=A0ABV5JHL4_9RHOB|nr:MULTISPECIES: cytochrome c-type biogenesis protein [Pseudohalocynthiibacter]MBS9716416.1 cytochrome c-type biogenesis protein CcmH [Pseudohalocynthiibacter aestuariivivens]MCK0100775.1 cytochrome c-type biogenesis protein CcmH [Pseudohalocynthiibacter sp. F2068]